MFAPNERAGEYHVQWRTEVGNNLSGTNCEEFDRFERNTYTERVVLFEIWSSSSGTAGAGGAHNIPSYPEASAHVEHNRASTGQHSAKEAATSTSRHGSAPMAIAALRRDQTFNNLLTPLVTLVVTQPPTHYTSGTDCYQLLANCYNWFAFTPASWWKTRRNLTNICICW